ncbi:MAG TPA: hypothetical protein DD438_12955 [Verrucomicrobiales bacterium]|nr:hypothetical protein [Verrucomicrobiales bacterium]
MPLYVRPQPLPEFFELTVVTFLDLARTRPDQRKILQTLKFHVSSEGEINFTRIENLHHDHFVTLEP